MNTVQRIAKNTGVLLISNIVSKVFSFFYVMYTARYLGAEGFGILSFALAFTGIFGVFSDLGLSPLTVREVARDKSSAGKYLNNITVMKLILVIITFALIALVINILGYPLQTIKVVYLIALSIIFSAFTRIFYSIFQAFEKMEYQSLGQVLNSILIFSGVMLAIKYNFTIIGFASLYFIASIVVLVYSFTILRLKFSNSIFISANKAIGIDWYVWKPIIKEALPFGLSTIFVTIYYFIDTVMLSLMVANANEVIGWYNAAYKLVLVLLVMRAGIQTSVFPIMSRFSMNLENSLKLICEKLFKYGIIFIFPIAIGTNILANRIILLIYGSEYLPSVIALKILIWSDLFIFANFAHRLFEVTNKQIIVAKITILGAIVNIILNLLLIPRFSYIGAAVATCFTELIVLFVGLEIFFKTKYKFDSLLTLKNISKVIVAGIIMGSFVKYFFDLNLLILIILSALVYIISLYLMKIFDGTDIYIFKGLLKSKINTMNKIPKK